MKIQIFTVKNKLFLPLLAFLVAGLVISVGYFYYHNEVRRIRKDRYSELKAIADLKTSQIIQWRQERIGSAKIFAESPFARQNIKRWLSSQDNSLRADILERMTLTKHYYRYEKIFLLSPDGEILLSSDTTLQKIDSVTISFCRSAAGSKKAVVSDFYHCPVHKKIHFDILAPVMDEKESVCCVLVLRVDPNDYLYAFIQSWDTPNKSHEIMLLRNDGENVLYLNDLKFQKNTAVNLRLPLTMRHLPAVQAALGYTGIFNGKDYRGIDVLAYISPVPGTLWFMVAKVDKDEIFSELYYWTDVIIVLTFVMLLFLCIGVVWLYGNSQRNVYKELLKTGALFQEKQEEFKATFYSIGDAVIITDINGLIQNMNPIAEKLTGWKESDARRKPIEEVFNIINEETRNKVKSPVRRALSEKIIVDLADYSLLIAKNGKEIPVADSGAPIWNKNNKISGVILVFRDQTEQRRAEKALQETLAFAESIVATVRNPLVVMDADMRVVMANRAFYSKFKVTVKETESKTFYELGNNQWDIPKLHHLMEQILPKSTSIEDYEVSHYFENLGQRTMLLNTRQICHYSKKTQMILVSVEDITERKRAEKEIRDRTTQLEATNKELEAFSYSVSHDLRAPLRAIDGFSRILLEDHFGKLGKEGKRVCKVICDNAKHMGQLIDDLLAFSRLSRAGLQVSLIDMKTMAKSVFFELTTPEIRQRISFKLGDLSPAYGDPSMMRQVWMNLISNAIKFSSKRESAVISINQNREENKIIYRITDNGAGFDVKYADKLFGVFQRLHSSNDFVGTGVGLAIVQSIIHRHDGQVWAEGVVDKGSSFYFSVPDSEQMKKTKREAQKYNSLNFPSGKGTFNSVILNR
jgi:PAS domain S-box-containing protein